MTEEDNRLIPHWSEQEDNEWVVTGYMCLTDFTYELGASRGGNQIFPTIEDLRRNLGCVDECGIVEVKIKGNRIVQEPDFSRYES